MKLVLAVFSVLFIQNTFGFEKYVCHSYDRESEVLTEQIVVLEKTGEARDYLENGEWMGTKIPYYFSLYNGLHWDTEFDTAGVVFTEDVYFKFTSDDGKTEFTIYLDEMEESYLVMSGIAKTTYFKCF
jgi:hypothetical protein